MENTSNTEHSSKCSSEHEEKVDFHGAAVIDEQGNEIEITEEMICNALNSFE